MVSELEKQRLENIERNQRAVREFQLKEAASSAFGDKEAKRTSGPKLGTSNAKRRKPKLDSPDPPRRVRNLRRHGISEADKAKYLSPPPPPAPSPSFRDEARKEGELKLQDFIAKGDWDQALTVMQGFGDKVSQGDLFRADAEVNDKDVATLRSEFSNDLVSDTRDIKVVPERITSIAFHPSSQKRIVFAGDKVGELGVWDADRPDDEGLLNFKFHTRGLYSIAIDPNNSTRVYTGSYDGSIRILDLEAQKSTEAFVYHWDLDAGISDFAIVDPNTLYYSTLDGHFGTHDMRMKQAKNPLLLCDKKIGGFAVNPLNTHQVSTASLDRTLKIWDLRKAYQLELAEHEEPKGAYLDGVYHSRLSISSSSWNTNGQIVCNGYDNTINIFDLATFDYGKDGNADLEPTVRLQHNCQTGRWVSILKARWQESPRDGAQKFVIGNMKRYADVFAGNGQQLAHLDADHLTAVPAVAQFHPSENWIVGGVASGKVYLWTPGDASGDAKVKVEQRSENSGNKDHRDHNQKGPEVEHSRIKKEVLT